MDGRTVVVLGGGVGGLTAANELRRLLSPQHRVVLIEQDFLDRDYLKRYTNSPYLVGEDGFFVRTADGKEQVWNEAAGRPVPAGRRELVELGSKLTQALGGTAGDDIETTKRFLKEFADRAPEEIRDDFKVIADAYAKIIDALGGLNLKPGETPSPEAILKLQQIGNEIDQARLQQASENIQRWANENCS